MLHNHTKDFEVSDFIKAIFGIGGNMKAEKLQKNFEYVITHRNPVRNCVVVP